MKRTLLDLTQSILASLNSDEVNSIGDTAESLQVAEILRTCYYNMVARNDLPIHDELFQLTASTNSSQPVIMYRPDHIEKITWIKYFNSNVIGSTQTDQFGAFSHDLNLDITSPAIGSATTAPGYEYVTILPVQQFIDHVNRFNSTDSDVGIFEFTPSATESDQTFTFYYKTDITPQFCTILQNYYVIFDAFDNTQDSTLQTNKTMCLGQAIPAWQAVDTFVPSLDDQQFPLLLNEAKSLAFYEIKQIPHPKADQETKRQWSAVQKNKAANTQPSYFDALPDFGRRAWSGSAGEWFHTFRNNTGK